MHADSKKPGYSFLVSPDSRLLLEELNRLLSRDNGPWERNVFWGDEEPDSRFWSSLRQQGLFAGKRAVIVRNAQDWPAAVWKTISAILANSCADIWPIFCLEVEQEKGKFKIPACIQKTNCFLFAQKSGWIWSAPALAGSALRKYVEVHAAQLGLNLEGELLTEFCSLVPADASAIASELAKLTMLAENGQIKREMFQSGLTNAESDAFALVRQLELQNLPAAWREVSRGNAANLLFFLVALLAKEMRLFWQLENGESPWLPAQEASLKKSLAKKLGRAGISSGFCALADAEWQVKSGRQTPEQTLEVLVIHFVMLFGGKNF